jgi:hypothetical protein
MRRKRCCWLEKLWMAVAKVNDKVVGLMWYKIEGFKGRLSVKKLLYLNSQGRFIVVVLPTNA